MCRIGDVFNPDELKALSKKKRDVLQEYGRLIVLTDLTIRGLIKRNPTIRKRLGRVAETPCQAIDEHIRLPAPLDDTQVCTPPDQMVWLSDCSSVAMRSIASSEMACGLLQRGQSTRSVTAVASFFFVLTLAASISAAVKSICALSNAR